MAQKEFRLPDVGEGLTEAEILTWHVKPGDMVKVNQIVVEIETAKSAVELPCPWEGTVTGLLVQEGDTVEVGRPIIAIDTEAGGGAVAAQPVQDEAVKDDMVPDIGTPSGDEAVEPGLIGGPAPGGRTSVLVGYGPRSTEAKRRPRKPGAGGAPAPAAPAAAAPAAPQAPAAPARQANGRVTQARVLAKPPVRKMAKDLGVDLATVAPSGPNGTITRADVEAASQGVTAEAFVPAPAGRPSQAYPFHPATREYRYPIKGVRKLTAQAMVSSAFTAPHVTEWVDVDVTRTMRLVDRLKGSREFEGLKVTPLLLVAKALMLAVRRHPEINASWDDPAQEIVVKDYVNLGIAAATPRGLVVPNIKNADAMTLPELAGALQDLAATAKAGRTPPADMASGTITITNVGVFGVDSGTPIINPGEAAILCFGQVRERPWVHEGEIAVRQVTQLALSFDHRLVDGELGSLVLADVAALLERPEMALVWA